jgi:hypothetical protein
MMAIAKHLICEKENFCYDLLIHRIDVALRGRPPWEKGKGMLRRFAHNRRREPDFSYFFARNPLKSPDSEK